MNVTLLIARQSGCRKTSDAEWKRQPIVSRSRDKCAGQAGRSEWPDRVRCVTRIQLNSEDQMASAFVAGHSKMIAEHRSDAETVGGVDYCCVEGARRLQTRIEAYWAARGRQVQVKLVEAPFCSSMRSARIDLRSNMINGWP